jgi:hypothetical protein
MLIARGVRNREHTPQSQERQLSRFALPASPEAWFFHDEDSLPVARECHPIHARHRSVPANESPWGWGGDNAHSCVPLD